MASDGTMTIRSCMQEDGDQYDDDDDIDDGCNHHPTHVSRLSMCTSYSMYANQEEADDAIYYQDVDDDDDDDDDEVGGNGMSLYMSRLSIESFDGDADEEFSDDKEAKELLGLSSGDSDKEPGCYSLPATPPRLRDRDGLLLNQQRLLGVKEYASENEAAQKGLVVRPKMRKNSLRRRRRRIISQRWQERAWDNFSNYSESKKKKEEEIIGGSSTGANNNSNSCFSLSGGESEGGSGSTTGGGVVVITRPKGGRRSLCMDLEEVKACRDLGFELEHERMLEMPSRLSISGSTLDTSSGGNSPIANWRISSPGDDPRDVKARLKVWAQAVALASASRHGSS